MDRRWTSHLKDPEEAKRFVSYIKNSRTVLDRLSEIVHDFDTRVEDRELSSGSYASPAWAYQQADNVGYRRALRDILQLITLDQKEI